MSSADHYTPWGTPQNSSDAPAGGPPPQFGSPPHLAASGARDAEQSDPQSPTSTSNSTPTNDPLPPSMQSPYGMPLTNGGSGGPDGPDDREPRGSDRRRKTLIASALAVVAVVGIGAAVALTDKGNPAKQPSSSTLAGAAGAEAGGANAGNGSGLANGGGNGKPDGDSMVADPSGSSASSGASSGNTTTGSKSTGGTTNAPKQATSSAAAPGTTAAKPAASTAKTAAAPPPVTDCTYMTPLPAQQMPTVQAGSTNTNAIKELQCLLKKSMLGIKPLAIDGEWGPATASALSDFQTCNNSPTVKTPGGTPPYPKLTVNTIASSQTWADLYFWDNQYFNGVAYYCNGTR